jgi:thioredoxin 1
MMALELTDANFQATVLDSDKLTLVDFWAEWCGPCRAIGPVIEELAKEYDGKVNIGKVNVDNNPNLSVNYGITSIPAILFIKGGQIVDKQIGAVPKSVLADKLNKQLIFTNCFLLLDIIRDLDYGYIQDNYHPDYYLPIFAKDKTYYEFIYTICLDILKYL